MQSHTQDYHQNAKHDRVRSDEPDQRERPSGGIEKQGETKQYGSHAGQRQQQLSLNVFAQLDRRCDFESAGYDCPRGDHNQEDQRGNPRYEKGD